MWHANRGRLLLGTTVPVLCTIESCIYHITNVQSLAILYFRIWYLGWVILSPSSTMYNSFDIEVTKSFSRM